MTRPLQKKRERFLDEEAAKKIWEKRGALARTLKGPQQFGLEVCEIFTGQQGQAGSAMKEMESRNQRTVDGLAARIRGDHEHPANR